MELLNILEVIRHYSLTEELVNYFQPDDIL